MRRLYFAITILLVLTSTQKIHAQKLNYGLGWGFGIGTFYTPANRLMSYFPSSTNENPISWSQNQAGINSSLQFYVKPAPDYQVGILANSSFFPSSKNAYGSLQLHQYSLLLQGELSIINKKLKTVGLGFMGGYGGLTADVRNSGYQDIQLNSLTIKPGEMGSSSVSGTSAGTYFRYDKHFSAPVAPKADGTYGAGTIVSVGGEAGVLHTWYGEKDFMKLDKAPLLYYIKICLGGGIFSFKP